MYASSDRHPNFNAGTAGQIIAFFASMKANRTLSKLKVIKLAYLADRESIKVQGEPITYDQKICLEHGPINSATLNLMNEMEVQRTCEHLENLLITKTIPLLKLQENLSVKTSMSFQILTWKFLKLYGRVMAI